jgi:hypothetical protein
MNRMNACHMPQGGKARGRTKLRGQPIMYRAEPSWNAVTAAASLTPHAVSNKLEGETLSDEQVSRRR